MNEILAKYDSLKPGNTKIFYHDGWYYIGKPKKNTWYKIVDLDSIRSEFKVVGMLFKPRFRGPRIMVSCVSPKGRFYLRNENLRSNTCLKCEAEYFTITNVVGY